ncbi:kinesin-like protein subito [Scaptodrosophila lebanonensis]|uniref:Kinesin-like protein n=1 Tax=Drosophila lebanonensis TaxID=7225 RepID=A0A6J2TZU3_DROLE|nr:kinesin-like protein subito [Scaptodrosophila lebanonensis]
MDNGATKRQKREVRSYLMSREPSIDRRFRPRPNKQLRLTFNDINESGESCSDCSDTESDYAATVDDEATKTTVTESSDVESGPQVFLRLRPVETPSKSYTISDCGSVFITGASNENSSNNVTKSNMEKHYSFTSIFDSMVGQRDIYDICVGPKIQEEESVTIMAYGTSGSGKTYTLQGDNMRAGIIPRALAHIFALYGCALYPKPQLKLINASTIILEDDAAIKEMQLRRQILAVCPDIQAQFQRFQLVIQGDHTFETKPMTDVSVMIWVSFVEIYNENVYDLLALSPRQANMAEPPRKNLKIVCNKGQVFIKSLTSIFVKSSEDALKLLKFGQQRLTYASTAVNANSSRSHCVFFVDILKFYRTGLTTQTSYKFCDLAGSERVDKTGTIGSRLKEAQRINTSLMVLGRCLDAASSSRKKPNPDVIPFRESKLTTLLQAPLLGRERLAMIVTVSPLDKYYEENLNVLNFASIAKNIIFKEPIIKQHKSRYSAFADCSQQVGPDRIYIEELEQENIELRAEIEQIKYEHVLQMQLKEEQLRKELTDTFKENMEFNLKQSEERMEKKLQMQQREFEVQLASIKRQYEDKIEDLQDEIEELKSANSDIEIIDDE